MLSVLITIGMIPVLKIFALRLNALDLPNHRKVHSAPMPKVGGVAMAMGAVVPILLWSPGNRFMDALLLGAAVLIIFGIVDDIKEMSYKGKLAGQIVAALIVVVCGGLRIECMGDCLPEGAVLPPWVSVPFTILAIVGVTNAINLSDGLDGLAGGISMMIFICLSFLAYQTGMPEIALLSVAVIGAIVGFLRFNTHPAVVFMGDAGSQLLGFLAVSLAVHISQSSESLSRAFPMLLLGFPILDTLTVMTERICKRVSPFKADKNHFHHKLMRLGLSHASAVIAIYALQFVLVMSAFLLRYHSEWVLVLQYLSFCAIVLACFNWTDKRGWRLPRHDLFDLLGRAKVSIFDNRQYIIKTSFGMLEAAAPLLMFFCCLSLVRVPVYLGYVSLVLSLALMAVWLSRKQWMLGMLRATFFTVVPYLIFLSHAQVAELLNERGQLIFQLVFGILALLAVMTLKFTRRQQGFKANPFDFLIIFASLIVTRIPEIYNSVDDVSLITAKVIALLFAFEVLLGETRGKVNKLNFVILISLGTLFFKAVL
jgi:UDP-GlcNAc:undecaprenyl-phosphate GlcNAc-1-phosphate transferase